MLTSELAKAHSLAEMFTFIIHRRRQKNQSTITKGFKREKGRFAFFDKCCGRNSTQTPHMEVRHPHVARTGTITATALRIQQSCCCLRVPSRHHSVSSTFFQPLPHLFSCCLESQLWRELGPWLKWRVCQHFVKDCETNYGCLRVDYHFARLLFVVLHIHGQAMSTVVGSSSPVLNQAVHGMERSKSWQANRKGVVETKPAECQRQNAFVEQDKEQNNHPTSHTQHTSLKKNCQITPLFSQ